jgi:hypothetical protein
MSGTVSRAAAFWPLAGVLFLLFMASAAPSPLYRVYQAQWRFPATTLTVVFAVRPGGPRPPRTAMNVKLLYMGVPGLHIHRR